MIPDKEWFFIKCTKERTRIKEGVTGPGICQTIRIVLQNGLFLITSNIEKYS